MKQIGLFEDCLYRELGGVGMPTEEHYLILKSLITNKIIPILGGGWYSPTKRKMGRKINLQKLKKNIFSSEKS